MKQPPSILLAEDNAADVFLVQAALQAHQVDACLEVVKDGEAAIRFIERAEDSTDTPCPQLILLDLNLPRKSGFEVLARLRQSKTCSHALVVVISSCQAPPRETESLNADRFFTKPSDYDQYMRLGAIVKQLLESTTANLSR